MQLHEFRIFKRRKTRRRIGRGGKRGTYSGRGVKGQKSRAGRVIRPAERDLILRLPKRRGFRNKPKSEKPRTVNLGSLSAVLRTPVAGEKLPVVDIGVLKAARLVPSRFKGRVKILGEGETALPFVVRGLAVSHNAKMKIEKAGGRVE